MSAPPNQPPGVAHETNSPSHFLRSRGRPEKRKSPLQADAMSSMGMSELASEPAQHGQAGRDQGASPAKKVKRASSLLSATGSLLLKDISHDTELMLLKSLSGEDQKKVSTLTGLERDEFLARALQEQLDHPLAKAPEPLTPNSEQKRIAQLKDDEAYARQLMEEDMLDGEPYPSDSDIVMTDDSEPRILVNSDGEFGSPLYETAADWNGPDNLMNGADEYKVIKAELFKAGEATTDPTSQTKKPPQTPKAHIEENKDEEIEKLCQELLSHVARALNNGKSTKDSVEQSIAPVPTPIHTPATNNESLVPTTPVANGSNIKEHAEDIIDLTLPYQPTPAVLQLQVWFSNQKLTLKCHTCRGVLTIDNSDACELVQLWTGINLMIKAPENSVQPPLSHSSHRFWERPIKGTSEGALTTKKTNTKTEDIGELLYPNLCGTIKCKGYCTKVSCIICAGHCDNQGSFKRSQAWHCDEARPLSLMVILGALDEWVIRGKVEDAARRRKLEKARAEVLAFGARQRREKSQRGPSEMKLIALVESEFDNAKLLDDLAAMKLIIEELCKLRYGRGLKGKADLVTPIATEREVKLLRLKTGFLSRVDELGRQKRSKKPLEDELVKQPETSGRTTRSMTKNLAGLKGIKDMFKATSSKQEKKKKSLFGHGAKPSGGDPGPLGSTLDHPSSPDMFHDHIYNILDTHGFSKSPQDASKPKFKKPNGTGYGGGPYYNSSFDVDDPDYDSLEEYAGSLLSTTDSMFGASPDNIAFHAEAYADALPQPHKVLSQPADTDETHFQDLLGQTFGGQSQAGTGALNPENIWHEANATKGSPSYLGPNPKDKAKAYPKNTSTKAQKASELTSPQSPGSPSTAELAWRFSTDYTKGGIAMVKDIEHKSGLGNPVLQAKKHPKTSKFGATAVESKQQSGKSNSSLPGNWTLGPLKLPSLVDVSSGDDIKVTVTASSPYQKLSKSTRASERIAKKVSEKSQKEKNDLLKSGNSANDSIVIEPDSDEVTPTSKSRKWSKRPSTTKKTSSLSTSTNGPRDAQNKASGTLISYEPQQTFKHATPSFHVPPSASSASKSSSMKYPAYTGPVSWSSGPGSHHPQQGPPAINPPHMAPMPHPLQSPPFIPTPPPKPGYGWSSSSSADPMGNFAPPMFSGVNPFVPYGPSGLFHTPKANNGPNLWVTNSPETDPQVAYPKSANGTLASAQSKNWAHFAAVAQAANPPTIYSRYGRSAGPMVERKNHRQEYQDKVLRSIFKMVSGAMPSDSNISSHAADAVDPSYPVTAEVLLTMLHTSWLGEKIEELFRNDSMTDISKRSDLYVSLLELTKKIGECKPIASFLSIPRRAKRSSSGLLKIAGGKGELELEDESSTTLWDLLEKLVKQAKVILKGVSSRHNEIEGDDMSTLALCVQIVNVYESVQSNIEWGKEKVKEQAEQAQMKKNGKGKQKASEGDLKLSNGLSSIELAQAHRQKQINFHQDLSFEHVEDFTLNHYHTTEIQLLRHSPKGRLMHLTKELATLATSLPEGIFVRVCEGRPDVIKCLIVGPEGTPYEGGLFEFDVWCPENYPNCPPKCQLKTTGGGTVGFNPNLYPDGKVCLSILGTWSGAPSEMWQPRLSTLLQVFISIQSMILCAKPYYNEPGRVEPTGKDTASESFNNYIKVHCVRYGMLEWLTDPDKRSGIWKDVVKGHFMVNGQKILETVMEWSTTTTGIKCYDPREAHSWRTHRSWTKSGKGRNLLEELEKSMSAVVLDELV